MRYVIGFANIRIHPSTRCRIRRAHLKISRFAVEFTGCVWTVAVCGKKKLRRFPQKYPDTCGWAKGIPLKLFLAPSSSADITRVLRGSFREGSVYIYVASFCFILKQRKISNDVGSRLSHPGSSRRGILRSLITTE